MQIQGVIANIQPAGGYNSQGGWINTFMMTINTAQGPVTGQIGSKSPQYPMRLGEPIAVESTTDQHGVKFKKVNPQYQGGGQEQGQPQGQQQGYPQQNQGRPQGQQQQQRPQHQQQGPDATGKMIIAQCSAKIVCELMVNGKFNPGSKVDMQSAVKDWFDIIIAVGSGMASPSPSYGGNQVPASYPDEQSQDGGFDDGSSIPF